MTELLSIGQGFGGEEFEFAACRRAIESSYPRENIIPFIRSVIGFIQSAFLLAVTILFVVTKGLVGE